MCAQLGGGKSDRSNHSETEGLTVKFFWQEPCCTPEAARANRMQHFRTGAQLINVLSLTVSHAHRSRLRGTQAGDIASSGNPERIVTDAVQAMGGLTTLVNCAGVLKPGAFGALPSSPSPSPSRLGTKCWRH